MSGWKYPLANPAIGAEEIARVVGVMSSGQITQAKTVHEFEVDFSKLMHGSEVVCCNSGTSALHLALLALGIGPGKRVAVPNLTFIATANAVAYCGAEVVLVDSDVQTWNADYNRLLSLAKQKQVDAIIVVHVYGVPFPALQIRELQKYVPVIEDAAEGLGGFFDNGMRLGSAGVMSTFSFYANKVISTGEGGCVVVNKRHAKYAERVRLLRGQGMHPGRRYYHPVLGYNYRMTELQAAIGLVQLERFEENVARRGSVMNWYRKYLGTELLRWPHYEKGVQAPWLTTVLVPHATTRMVTDDLTAAGIETRPVFVPMSEMPMYRRRSSSFPMSMLIHDRGISLPTHPQLDERDVQFISERVLDSLEHHK